MQKTDFDKIVNEITEYIKEHPLLFPDINSGFEFSDINDLVGNVIMACGISQLYVKHGYVKSYSLEEIINARQVLKFNNSLAHYILVNYFGESEDQIVRIIPDLEEIGAVHECSLLPELETYNKLIYS